MFYWSIHEYLMRPLQHVYQDSGFLVSELLFSCEYPITGLPRPHPHQFWRKKSLQQIFSQKKMSANRFSWIREQQIIGNEFFARKSVMTSNIGWKAWMDLNGILCFSSINLRNEKNDQPSYIYGCWNVISKTMKLIQQRGDSYNAKHNAFHNTFLASLTHSSHV